MFVRIVGLFLFIALVHAAAFPVKTEDGDLLAIESNVKETKVKHNKNEEITTTPASVVKKHDKTGSETEDETDDETEDEKEYETEYERKNEKHDETEESYSEEDETEESNSDHDETEESNSDKGETEESNSHKHETEKLNSYKDETEELISDKGKTEESNSDKGKAEESNSDKQETEESNSEKGETEESSSGKDETEESISDKDETEESNSDKDETESNTKEANDCTTEEPSSSTEIIHLPGNKDDESNFLVNLGPILMSDFGYTFVHPGLYSLLVEKEDNVARYRCMQLRNVFDYTLADERCIVLSPSVIPYDVISRRYHLQPADPHYRQGYLIYT